MIRKWVLSHPLLITWVEWEVGWQQHSSSCVLTMQGLWKIKFPKGFVQMSKAGPACRGGHLGDSQVNNMLCCYFKFNEQGFKTTVLRGQSYLWLKTLLTNIYWGKKHTTYQPRGRGGRRTTLFVYDQVIKDFGLSLGFTFVKCIISPMYWQGIFLI